MPLPPVPYEACDTRPTRVTSLSLVRYRRNDYSVPTAYGHRDVVVKGYVDVVVIVCGSEEIARHRRSYGREELIFDPLHYLALLERKTGALDQAAPLTGWALPDEFLRLRRLLETRLGKAGPASMCRSCGSSRTFGWPTSAALSRTPCDWARSGSTPSSISFCAASTTGRPASTWRSIRISRPRG